MDDLPVGMMGQPPQVIARYRKMVKAGESPRLAEMFACRKAPGLETDTAHYAGMRPLEETAGKDYATKVKQQARAAGINITDNSIYNATLADGRGGADPNAWIHAGDGRAKVKRVIEAKGGGCESLGVTPNGRAVEIEAKKKAALDKRRARRLERTGKADP